MKREGQCQQQQQQRRSRGVGINTKTDCKRAGKTSASSPSSEMNSKEMQELFRTLTKMVPPSSQSGGQSADRTLLLQSVIDYIYHLQDTLKVPPMCDVLTAKTSSSSSSPSSSEEEVEEVEKDRFGAAMPTDSLVLAKLDSHYHPRSPQ